MNKVQQQVVALAGLLQSTQAVEAVAQQGSCEDLLLETAINSIFVTSPKSTLDVYGNLGNISTGLKQANELMGPKSTNKQLRSVKYALAIIHLEQKVSKHSTMLETLGRRLDQASTQVQHFGILHENVIANLAGIYTDTVSTFNLKVHVSGQERFLTIDHNAAKIRCLLLAGIRSAMLWRQLGGRRWQFIFQRNKIHSASKHLLT